MEQQKLPNVTAIIVLGIASILLCWCYGILGLILAVIALILANSSAKTYRQDPESYLDYGSLKTGKVIAIIGLILNVLFLLLIVWMVSAIGLDVIQSGDEELMKEAVEEWLGQ